MPQNQQLTTDDLINMIDANRPPHLSGADSSTAGMGHIIRILSENEKAVSAGTLSRLCHVSTARIAVLLRKLEEKGMIARSDDPEDARKTLITLTDAGKCFSEKKQAEFRASLQKIIDSLGEERLREYIATTREIKKILTEGFMQSKKEDSELLGSGEEGNN